MAIPTVIEAARMGTLLASSTRSLTTGGTNVHIQGYPNGVLVVLDVTAIVSGAPSLTVEVRLNDAASGKNVNLIAHASITAVGTYIFAITPKLASYPGATATYQGVLSAVWNVRIIASNTDQCTYSVGYTYI